MYGIFYFGKNRIELHADLITAAESLGYDYRMVKSWLNNHNGSYMGNEWVITNHITTFKSRRGKK